MRTSAANSGSGLKISLTICLPSNNQSWRDEVASPRPKHNRGDAYIFAFNERYDIDEKTLKNTARYINHSCEPNCEAVVTKRTIGIVALRDIQAGEELSYNYGLTAKQYRCRCGAKQCCGYILDPQYW